MKTVSAAFGAVAAIAALTTSAVAAPVVGPPFFLANPHGDTADTSIASSSSGFVLAWSAAGDTWAQRYTTSASITGSPFLLAKGGSSMVPSSNQSTSTSRVEVVSNGVDFAARWVNYKTLAICCVSPYTWEDFGGAVIRASGAPVPSATFGVSGTPTSLPYGAVASARPDWVVLDSLLTITPPTSGQQRASVGWVAPDGATTTVLLFQNEPLNAAAFYGFRVASVGATALAAWSPPAPAERVFAIAQKTGNVSTLTNAALPVAADHVVLATNGTDYLVVWPGPTGSVQALRVSSTGAVIGAPIVVWNGSDAGGVPAIVSVKAAGSTYLFLLQQPVGADGSTLFGIRVLADGTVLDPSGFEVPARAGGALTSVSDDLWLLATLDSVNGASIIRGRYIGATTVPTPPDNVEPPLPPDAGAPSDAAVPDAAPGVEASAGGAAASGTGGMPPIGSGGDNRPRPPKGSGGRNPIDAGSAGRGTSGNGSATTSGGCGCVLARSEPAHAHIVASLTMLAVGAGAMRWSRRVNNGLRRPASQRSPIADRR